MANMIPRVRSLVLFFACLSFISTAAPPEMSKLDYLLTMTIPEEFHPTNRSFSVIGVTYAAPNSLNPRGTLYIVSRTVDTAGVYSYDLSTGNMRLLMGTKGKMGCVENSDEAVNASYPVTPISVEAINSNNVIFADGMPSSRVFLISTLNERVPMDSASIRISTLLGAYCNFTQKTMTPNSAASSRANAIAPPSYVKYIPERQLLFFTQSSFVAVVQNDTMSVYFGSFSEKGSRNSSIYGAPIFRTDSLTDTPSQMDVLDDKLYVAEKGMGTVREIDLNTGMTRVVLGSPPTNVSNNNSLSWPPKNCTRANPCSPVNSGLLLIAPTSIAIFAPYGPTGDRWMFVGDLTEAVIYKLDMQSNTAVIFDGQLLKSGRTDGDITTSLPLLSSLRQLAVSNDTLFIADGLLRSVRLVGESDSEVQQPSQPKELCSLIRDCSGRAIDVDGLPAIQCRCTCRTGWKGDTCAKREKWNAVTLTRTVPRPEEPDPEPIPPAVKKAAQATVVVSAVVGGIVSSPTLGVQASRATLLLKISKCAQKFDEPLEWATSVLQLTIGSSDMRYIFGAVVGNLSVLLCCMIVHAFVAYFYSKTQHMTTTEAFAKFRFPSLEVLPISLMLEGTVMCAFVMVYHFAKATEPMLVTGIIALVTALAMMLVLGYYLLFHFRCKFSRFKTQAKVGGRALTRWQRTVRWLMHGSGKWIEEEGSWFRRRFAALFVDYRPGAHYFVLYEFAMSITCGVIEAVMPGEDSTMCFPLLVVTEIVFATFFVCVIVLRPNLTRFSLYTSVAVAGLQGVSALLLIVFALTTNPTWETLSASLAIVAIYIIAVKTLLDILEVISKIGYWCTKQFQKKPDCKVRKAIPGFDVMNEQLDTPMLEHSNETGPEQQQQQQEMQRTFSSTPSYQGGSFGREPAGLERSFSNDYIPAYRMGSSFDRQTALKVLERCLRPQECNPTPPRETMEHERMRIELESRIRSPPLTYRVPKNADEVSNSSLTPSHLLHTLVAESHEASHRTSRAPTPPGQVDPATLLRLMQPLRGNATQQHGPETSWSSYDYTSKKGLT